MGGSEHRAVRQKQPFPLTYGCHRRRFHDRGPLLISNLNQTARPQVTLGHAERRRPPLVEISHCASSKRFRVIVATGKESTKPSSFVGAVENPLVQCSGGRTTKRDVGAPLMIEAHRRLVGSRPQRHSARVGRRVNEEQMERPNVRCFEG